MMTFALSRSALLALCLAAGLSLAACNRNASTEPQPSGTTGTSGNTANTGSPPPEATQAPPGAQDKTTSSAPESAASMPSSAPAGGPNRRGSTY